MCVHLARGTSDDAIDNIAAALSALKADHPTAEIALYRRNPGAVRVRIITPDFAGLDGFERSDLVWKYLAAVPNDHAGDISMMVLLAPGEEKFSLINLEFDDPSPSLL